MRWDDQEKIKKKLVSGGGGGGGQGTNIIHFTGLKTEYAKSNRSSCRHCGDTIDKVKD